MTAEMAGALSEKPKEKPEVYLPAVLLYLVHVLDHPARTPALRRPSRVIANEYTG